MTIAMPDSIRPQDMPKGYAAYLAYVDGERSRDADQVRAMFPGAQILTLTVLGGDAVADGCDREPGDLSPEGAALWLHGRIAAGAHRPVLYDSRDDIPATLAVLAGHGVTRQQIRILSAHYGHGQHICSPACGAKFQADGTQWTDEFPGAGDAKVDMSLLDGDFFGAPAGWVFTVVRGLDVEAIGPHSVRLSWSSPGTAAPEAVQHYQVTIRKDGGDVASYPRDVPKGTNPESVQFGSLVPGTQYEALVRAVAADGHASPWSAVTFQTPA